MDYLKGLLTKVGDFVDALVPFAQGMRTKIAVVACPLLGFVTPYIPAEYQPVAVVVQKLLCATVVPFAVAGLVRDGKKA